MIPPKQAGWLDQLISQARPGGPPRADFEVWRSAHGTALRRLKQRGAQVPRHEPRWAALAQRGITAARSPHVRLAVAALLVLGVFVWVSLRRDHAPSPAKPPVAVPTPASSPIPGESEIAERELALAHELFTQGDARGLLALLGTAHPSTAVAVAAYLGQVGDISSVPTLDAFAARWQGPSQDNPFEKAATQIRSRWERNDTNAAAVRPPPAASPPRAAIQPPSPKENEVPTCRGVVVDRTGAPAGNARVWAQSCSRDLKITDLGTPAVTDSRGRFSLRMPTEGRSAAEVIYLLCKHPPYAPGWVRLSADWSTTDRGDFEIILSEPAVVSGTVLDSQGRPIPTALVEARVAAAYGSDNVHEYPYTVGNHRAVKTDAQGRFILADVPAGSALNLLVSRAGYSSYDSRESEGRSAVRPPAGDSQTYTVRAGEQNLVIELVSAIGRIDGRIVRVDGTSYDENVTLLCERAGDPAGAVLCGYAEGKWTLWERAQRGRRSATKGGHFQIEDLPMGAYWIAAADPVSMDLLTVPVRVTVTGRPPQDQVILKVSRPSRVTVHLLDTVTGKPVAGALVVADCGMKMQRHTDTDGLCVLQLVPGDYLISTYGWTPGATPVHVASHPRDQRVEILVAVPPPCPGRLLDEFGMPVPGLVYPVAGQRVSTDIEGRFLTPWAASSSVSLATDMTGTRARLFWQKATAGSAELGIRLERLAMITGRIVDGYSHPVGGSMGVSFLTPGTDADNYRPIDQLGFKTRLLNGRFQFEVPVGVPLVVKATWGNSAGRSELIDPAPGQTYDLGDITLQLVPYTKPGAGSPPK